MYFLKGEIEGEIGTVVPEGIDIIGIYSQAKK